LPTRIMRQQPYSTTALLCAPRDLSKMPKPKDVKIPMDKVEFKYARSSGPGGQNVNKVNSKAEIRFQVKSAFWLPEDVRARLGNYQSGKINNEGELIVVSQEFRTQSQNKDACVGKLQVMIAEAYLKPKERKMWEGIGDKGKAIRRETKARRSDVKQNRRKNFKGDDY
jgi:protein subunit release factor B